MQGESSVDVQNAWLIAVAKQDSCVFARVLRPWLRLSGKRTPHVALDFVAKKMRKQVCMLFIRSDAWLHAFARLVALSSADGRRAPDDRVLADRRARCRLCTVL